MENLALPVPVDLSFAPVPFMKRKVESCICVTTFVCSLLGKWELLVNGKIGQLKEEE